MKSSKTIYVDSNGNVAEPTDPAMTYRLVVVAGGEISDADMAKFKLTAADLSGDEPKEAQVDEKPVEKAASVGVLTKPEEKDITLGKPKAK